MELLEFVNYNYLNKNEDLTFFLEKLLDKMNNDDIKEEYKRDVKIAIGKSKGYTEYKTKEIAKTIGISKTALKYMCENLESENKIILIKDDGLTFIKPIIS